MTDSAQASASPRTARRWVIATVAGIVLLGGVTAIVALQTERKLRTRFEAELLDVYKCYSNYEATHGKPPPNRGEFERWLGEVTPPQTRTVEVVTSGRAVVAWGTKLPPYESGSETIFAYSTDPPVRGERLVVMLDGRLRWLNAEEFAAASKAEGLD